MNLAVPVAGFFLTVLIIMFGGRKRRSLEHASYAAAGLTITILALGAIVWLMTAVISQFLNADN